VVLDQAELADSFALLDDRGTELEMTEMLHRDAQSWAFSMDTRTRIVDGRSSVVRAPETARALVLFKGEAEVLRLPLQLDPEQPTVIRR
jgi:hypothetical protein